MSSSIAKNLPTCARKTKANGSRSTRQDRRNRASDVVTHRQLKGGPLHVPTNPPSVSYQPWYPLTLVHTSTSGSLTITMADLVKQVRSQIDPCSSGFTTNLILNMKIQKIRAWNLTGSMIALSVDDFSTPDQAKRDTDTLCGLVDTGSTMHIPAVGYDLPDSLKNVVLRNSSGTPSDSTSVIYHLMCNKDDSVIVYTNLLWKFDGPLKISSFNSTMLGLVGKISDDASDLRTTALDIRKSVLTMEKNSESLGVGKVLIKGIETAAPYVLPAVAAADGSLVPINETILRLSEALERLDSGQIDPELSLKDWIITQTSRDDSTE